jgi:hypothetical protein
LIFDNPVLDIWGYSNTNVAFAYWFVRQCANRAIDKNDIVEISATPGHRPLRDLDPQRVMPSVSDHSKICNGVVVTADNVEL